MKVNFKQPILDYDDKPIQENGEEVLVQKVAVRALMQTEKDDAGRVKNIKPEDMLKKDELARSIHKFGECELSAEDITLVKRRIAEFRIQTSETTWEPLAPLILGECYRVIDPKPVKDKPN